MKKLVDKIKKMKFNTLIFGAICISIILIMLFYPRKNSIISFGVSGHLNKFNGGIKFEAFENKGEF